jgi:hypothetical protein
VGLKLAAKFGIVADDVIIASGDVTSEEKPEPDADLRLRPRSRFRLKLG